MNRQIDEVSEKLHRSPTLILFEEWGTSGRKRATVSDLLELLKKVELYRAADFVAMDILKTEPPKRPDKGPSARVDVTLPEPTLDEQQIEEILREMGYPNSTTLAANIDSTINNNNRDFNNVDVDRVKPIHLPLPLQSSEEQSDSDSHSDFIEFSATKVSATNNDAVDLDIPLSFQTEEAVHSPTPLSSEIVLSSLLTMNQESDQGIRSILVPDFEQLQVGNLSILINSNVYSTGSQLNVDDTESQLDATDSQIQSQSQSQSQPQSNINSSDLQFLPNLSLLNGAASDNGNIS